MEYCFDRMRVWLCSDPAKQSHKTNFCPSSQIFLRQNNVTLLRQLHRCRGTTCSQNVTIPQSYGPLERDGDGRWSKNNRGFITHQEEFRIQSDGMLGLGDRLVIPPPLHQATLNELHNCHFGVEKMKFSTILNIGVWWLRLGMFESFVSAQLGV